MSDWSQHGEQAVILDFFKEKSVGRFLDCGANDGCSGSNTRALAELGWSGVLVEASPRIYLDLVKNCYGNPKLFCLNAAIQSQPGFVRFQEMGEQCGSCNVQHQPSSMFGHSYWLNAATPSELAFYFFFGEYDFVSLDIEGGDLEVLKVMGPLLLKTQLLCIEDALPCADFDQGYYDQMLAAAASHGLSREVARTNGGAGKGNTLLARQ